MLEPPKPQFDPIDPRWLLKSAAAVVVAALVCAYLTLCLLFYQGQWQFVLHPAASTTPLTALASISAQPIRFDAVESGTPRLSGTLIPAVPVSRYETYIILYIRGGDASLAKSPKDARNLATLHTLGLNVFAFDYRGFGQSDPIHPTQSRMTEDTDAAFRYLRDTRSIPENHIIPFGVGLGASLAANLTAAHPTIPAAIFEPPAKSPLAEVLADPRARLLPVRLLFHETFPLNTLTTLPTPKLLLLDTVQGITRAPLPPTADPKFTLNFESADTSSLNATLTRFVDQYLQLRALDVPVKE